VNFRFEEIHSSAQLLPHKASILNLFQEVFGKTLDHEVWDWAYLRNPAGPAFVSLCFDGPVLAGHYACIPLSLESSVEKINCMLSMTTMVEKQYQGMGLFTNQAQRVYTYAQQKGVKIVLGFPNQNSAPGFIKRLNWKINNRGTVIKVSGREIKDNQDIQHALFYGSDIKLATGQDYLAWRLAKPNSHYIKISDNLILKDFETTKDIVLINQNGVNELDDHTQYSVFVSYPIINSDCSNSFDYMFGARSFDSDIDTSRIKVDLLMSDVF